MSGTEVKKKLREIIGTNPNLPIQAEVVSVENESCTIKLANGLELDEVRLKATINGGNNFFLIRPKVGSKVLILSITGKLDDLMVLRIDEIDNIEIQQNDLKILLDSQDNKIEIRNGETSLSAIFENLTDVLKNFKVFTPAGPSGLPLPNVITKIENFEIEFKKLLK